MDTNQVKIHATFGDITKITFEEMAVDEALKTLHTNIAGFLQENVPQERAPALFQKMNRIFPFMPESEDENAEEPQED